MFFLLFSFHQPMAQGEFADRPEGPIVEDKSPEEIRAEPYNMPGGFEFNREQQRLYEERGF